LPHVVDVQQVKQPNAKLAFAPAAGDARALLRAGGAGLVAVESEQRAAAARRSQRVHARRKRLRVRPGRHRVSVVSVVAAAAALILGAQSALRHQRSAHGSDLRWQRHAQSRNGGGVAVARRAIM